MPRLMKSRKSYAPISSERLKKANLGWPLSRSTPAWQRRRKQGQANHERTSFVLHARDRDFAAKEAGEATCDVEAEADATVTAGGVSFDLPERIENS